jgi:DNA polymerase elongation subunit (family B)
MKEAGKDKNWSLYNEFHLKQHSFKIIINSLYGAMSLPSFRYTDGKMFISNAITLSGQRIIQESIKFINEQTKKELSDDKQKLK